MSNDYSLSQTKPMKFQNGFLAIIPDNEHEFVMSTEEVAKGYSVTANAINTHRRRQSNELIENKHYFFATTICGNEKNEGFKTKKTYWTKRGVIRLGMFIKSQRAVKFRDWAESLIIQTTQPSAVPVTQPTFDFDLSDVDIKNVAISSLGNHIKARAFEFNDDMFIRQADVASVASQGRNALTVRLKRNTHNFIEGKDYIHILRSYWWSKRCLINLGYVIYVDEQNALTKTKTRALTTSELFKNKGVTFRNVSISSLNGTANVRGVVYDDIVFVRQNDLANNMYLSDSAFYKMLYRRKESLSEGKDFLRIRHTIWWSQDGINKLGYPIAISLPDDTLTEHDAEEPLTRDHGNLTTELSPDSPPRKYIFDEAQVSGHTLGNEKLIIDSINALVHKYCAHDMMAGIRSQDTSWGKIYAVEDILIKLFKKLPEQMKSLAFNRN